MHSKKYGVFIVIVLMVISCQRSQELQDIIYDNPIVDLIVPEGFPELNPSVLKNKPTKYGVLLGEMLFNEPKFSSTNTISCASCHQQKYAFSDQRSQAEGVFGRRGLRNTPPLQNLAFLKFYNWDGNVLQLEKQALVPIITHEEMNSSILEVIEKLEKEKSYKDLFAKAFGDANITAERIFKSLAQYQYTLISADSKYDHVMKGKANFTEQEARGYALFNTKCSNCHSTTLFTDQSFRNVGFPINQSSQEAGRARVTGDNIDYMRFRVPSLRNVAFTAPYGSFGQFPTLMEVLEYFNSGVLIAENLDPFLKDNGGRIPMTKNEREDIIAFLETLSDDIYID